MSTFWRTISLSLVWWAAALAPAAAGLHHRDAGLTCSDCHVAHLTTEGGQPTPKLLKTTEPALCLSCHDGQGGGGDLAPDVMESAGPGQAAHRAAGAFRGGPGQTTGEGHDLLVAATPPGGSGTMTLTCLSCHDPHGNSYYRNLVPNPGGSTGRGVTAVSEAVTTPTATQYDISNSSYRASDGGLSQWCAGCHGDFHGAGGAVNMAGSLVGDTNQSAVTPWLRHPTRDVSMAQARYDQHVDSSRWFSALGSRIPVVSPTGIIPGTALGSDNEVFCGSCHKAHGSPHRYGLLLDDAATAAPEDGNSPLDTCQQCHYK